MSFRVLFGFSGKALIGGGILLALGYALTSVLMPLDLIAMFSNPLTLIGYVLRIVGATFVLLGLPAVFVRQAQTARLVKLSFLGVVLTFLGIAVIEVSMNSINAFIFPPLATNPATQALFISMDANRPMGASVAFVVGLLCEMIGPPLLGIAILRTKVLPRLAGWVLVFLPLSTFLGLPDYLVYQAVLGVIVAIMLGLSFALCGTGLLSYQDPESGSSVSETEPQREAMKV